MKYLPFGCIFLLFWSIQSSALSHEELASICRSSESVELIKIQGQIENELIDLKLTRLGFRLNSYRRIYAFEGNLDTERRFFFGRDGDVSDGDIEEIGNYDVSVYPHNFRFVSYLPNRHDEDADFQGFYGMAGTYRVHSVGDPRSGTMYIATFKFTQLADGNNRDNFGPIIPGYVEGCIQAIGF